MRSGKSGIFTNRMAVLMFLLNLVLIFPIF